MPVSVTKQLYFVFIEKKFFQTKRAEKQSRILPRAQASRIGSRFESRSRKSGTGQARDLQRTQVGICSRVEDNWKRSRGNKFT